MAKAMLFFNPVHQFFNDSGEVLNGGSITFYEPGTTTPKDTYTSSSKGTANPNPVVLDSAGRPDNSGTPIQIWLDGAYKVVLKNSSGSTIRTEDNVTTLGTLFDTLSKTADYTITESDRDKVILGNSTSNNVTLTLPAAATAGSGFIVYAKKIDSSSNDVILDGNASETIDGAATYSLVSENDSIGIICDGSNWESFSRSLSSSGNDVLDANSNELLVFNTTASAVNELAITNAATGGAPKLSAEGDDTDVALEIEAKGAGDIVLDPGTTGDVDIEGASIKIEDAEGILDDSENEQLIFQKTASAVNYFEMTNAATGTAPKLSVAGSDTDVGIEFQVKGNARYNFLSTADRSATISLYEDTDSGVSRFDILAPSAITTNRTWTLPDCDITNVVVQRVASGSATEGSTTTAIPLDDSIPQNTEGAEFLTVTITPKNTNNVLVIEFDAFGSASGALSLSTALFQDSTANALVASTAYVAVANALVPMRLKHVMTAGTTSSTTFKIRYGTPSGTAYILQTGSSPAFGGVNIGYLTITEYSA